LAQVLKEINAACVIAHSSHKVFSAMSLLHVLSCLLLVGPSLGDEAVHDPTKLKALQDDVEKAVRALYQEVESEKISMLAGKPKIKKGAISMAPAIPFGTLEAFGREDTASELTDASITESNAMVDQIENAVVAETKRSMFRALTRLRGATIANFDGMANAQSANVAQYAKDKQWTQSHELNHLAKQEANVGHWAFPNSPKPAGTSNAGAVAKVKKAPKKIKKHKEVKAKAKPVKKEKFLMEQSKDNTQMRGEDDKEAASQVAGLGGVAMDPEVAYGQSHADTSEPNEKITVKSKKHKELKIEEVANADLLGVKITVKSAKLQTN